MAKKDSKAPAKGKRPDLQELGSTGLNRTGGFVHEEFLTNLRGLQGARVYREMSDNDPTIGGMVFSVEKVIGGLDWRVDPFKDDSEDGKSTDADKEVAAFVESCLHDMENSWEQTLSGFLSFLVFGYSVHEIVYKIRGGAYDGDITRRSQFDDGKIGWRKLPVRAQETLFKWEFDPKTREILAMVQMDISNGGMHTIPMEKALHFRTTSHKDNPEGRALDPSTPIPTPDGWRTMGELLVGDKIFDEEGRIRYVVARADWDNRPCYKITFNDGFSIIADENHEWLTHSLNERSDRASAKIRTTSEIAKSVKNNQGISNHSISWAKALDYPKQVLPIDPYYLGQWLGDGSSYSAVLYTHADDAEEVAALVSNAVGYPTKIKHNGLAGGLGRKIVIDSQWDSKGTQSQLTAMGLMRNKHIPDAYLRGSKEQRLALLAGLMDSDGTVDSWGRCQFTNTNKNLIDGVAELVRSLGCGASVLHKERYARKDDRTIVGKLDVWNVSFTPDWSPFYLSRKSAKIIGAHARRQHYIVSVEPVESRSTVCIETDAPSHLFLAGEGMVPTHNSILRNVYRAWHFGRRLEEIEAIGVERDLAGLPIMLVPPELLSASASDDEKALLLKLQQMVTRVKRNEQEGLIIPAQYNDEGHLIYDFKLLSTGGARNFDTDKIIARWDQRKTMALLSDFLLLGHDGGGNRSLGITKMELWTMAVDSIAKNISSVINQHAIPRLMKLNGLDTKRLPKLNHGQVSNIDLAEIGTFVSELAKAGLLIPDIKLENFLREIANLPPAEHDGSNYGMPPLPDGQVVADPKADGSKPKEEVKIDATKKEPTKDNKA